MPPLHICFALGVTLMWGGNFIAAKYSLAYFPPVFASGLRFLLAALVLVPLVARPTQRELKAIAVLSVLGALHFSLPYVGMSLGLTIASTAIVAQLGVPFSCLLGALMLRDRLGKWRLSGLAIAFAGLLIVLGSPNALEHPLAFMLTLTGAFFWGLSNIMMKMEHIEHVNPLQMMGWMSLFIAPQLLLASALLEPSGWALLPAVPLLPALGVAYTVLISTILAHGLWYFLIKKHPVTQVAPFSLLVPVLGTLFAQYIFAEPISWHVLLGGALTLVGVAIIVIRRPKIVAHGEAT
jgi:O-acetylserine/cysteine efflux transporter